MVNEKLLSTVKSLPAEQRLALASAILDDLAQEGELPISDAMKTEIDRRLREFDADPTGGQPWSEVKAELFGK